MATHHHSFFSRQQAVAKTPVLAPQPGWMAHEEAILEYVKANGGSKAWEETRVQDEHQLMCKDKLEWVLAQPLPSPTPAPKLARNMQDNQLWQ